MKTATWEVPEELLMEILSWLPLKSLLRFRSVSKRWYALLTQNPNFISLHHRRAQKQDCLFFRRQARYATASGKKQPPFVLSFIPPTSQTPAAVEEEDLDALSFSADLVRQRKSCISSACNGLLSLAIVGEPTILICNPAMREFRLLPPPPSPYHGIPWFTRLLGFGFDPIANDYKLFRVAACSGLLGEDDDEKVDDDDEKVQLYDLRTDSWRVVVDSVPKANGGDSYCKSLNGVFYWLVDCPAVVVAFRLFDESLERIPLPLPDVCLEAVFVDLLTMRDSLALVHSTSDVRSMEESFDIWVMDGYGGGKKEFNWTKKYTLGPNLLPGALYYPFGFCQNGELLLVRCIERERWYCTTSMLRWQKCIDYMTDHWLLHRSRN